MDSAMTAQGFISMWHTPHLPIGHSAHQLGALLRAMHRQAWHALLTKLADPTTVQTLLLAMATIMFVLACVGLTFVGEFHAH
jgi:hypothetical protein